jgi:RNA polymerase sigma-70 factor (ECF subfamily)
VDKETQSSTADLSDEQLVTRYREGEEAAFASLVDRYQRELFHFLFRFLGKRAPAEDVFQDTFLQIHLSIDKFDVDRRFKPWLFTIAANKARDHLRRKSQRPLAPLSAPLDASQDQGRQFIDLLQADLVLPDEQVEKDEMRQLVRQAVDTLPNHLREILLLAYFQRLAYAEIAEVLGIPLGTVKSRLHSAVANFAQEWKRQETD